MVDHGIRGADLHSCRLFKDHTRIGSHWDTRGKAAEIHRVGPGHVGVNGSRNVEYGI